MDYSDPNYRLFADSSINPYDYDKHGRILETMLREHGGSDGLLAVSELRSTGLVAVFRDGHMVAQEKGLFSKRIEMIERISYADVSLLVMRQVGVRGRDGMIIDGIGHGRERLFELRWGCGGPVSEADAATERDRMFAVISSLVEAI
ncbi:MAG: hypothetical protein ACLPUT_01535 [Solirubrobacteraceae bacterium]